MSIVLAPSKSSLMFPAAVWLLLIKDLKDLNNIARHRIYRHAGPKGPEDVLGSAIDMQVLRT